jgi:hypothetical protein
VDRLTAQATGRSVFANQIREIGDARPLKVGNSKIGSKTTRAMMGAPAGMPIYGLTLEERATCPTSCEHFRPHQLGTGAASCYGDNMRWAIRYSFSPALLTAIESQVAELASAGPVLVRLHVLGDFPTVRYVMFWHRLLVKYPNLRIYGYTHRDRTDPIGLTIDEYLNRYERCAILLSGNDRTREWNRPHASTFATFTDPAFNNQRANRPQLPYLVRCPEQLTKTTTRGDGVNCASCGLCMRQYGSDIGFSAH